MRVVSLSVKMTTCLAVQTFPHVWKACNTAYISWILMSNGDRSASDGLRRRVAEAVASERGKRATASLHGIDFECEKWKPPMPKPQASVYRNICSLSPAKNLTPLNDPIIDCHQETSLRTMLGMRDLQEGGAEGGKKATNDHRCLQNCHSSCTAGAHQVRKPARRRASRRERMVLESFRGEA